MFMCQPLNYVVVFTFDGSFTAWKTEWEAVVMWSDGSKQGQECCDQHSGLPTTQSSRPFRESPLMNVSSRQNFFSSQQMAWRCRILLQHHGQADMFPARMGKQIFTLSISTCDTSTIPWITKLNSLLKAIPINGNLLSGFIWSRYSCWSSGFQIWSCFQAWINFINKS